MLSIHNRIAFALLTSLAAISAAGAVGCVADAQDTGAEDMADEDTGERVKPAGDNKPPPLGGRTGI